MGVAAYLRVYLPDSAVGGFPEHDGPLPARGSVMIGDGIAVWQESDRNDAFVAEVDGRLYVCPRTPRLRKLEGLIAFRRSYPGSTASVLVPDTVADRAAAELEHIHSRSPGVRSHILTSPFFAPLRWFVAFEPNERELVEGPGGLGIRYRTSLARAARRLDRAVAVLDGVGFDDEIIDEVREVARWLSGFPEDSLVELDYGGVAALFSDADLVLDDTAGDIRASLTALGQGDLDEAGDRYAAAATRWAHAQALTYAN